MSTRPRNFPIPLYDHSIAQAATDSDAGRCCECAFTDPHLAKYFPTYRHRGTGAQWQPTSPRVPEKQLQTVAKCPRRREHRNVAAAARNVRAWHLRGDLRQRWHPRLEYAHDGTVLQLDWSAHRGEPGHLHKASLQSQRSATMVNAPSCPNGQVVQMSRAGGAVAAVVDFASQSYMAKWGRHMGATGTNQEMRDINARRWARTCALPLARCAGCRRSRAAHYRHPQLLDGTRGGGGDRDGKNRRVHDLLLSHSFR